MAIGDNVGRLRRKKGWTQRELAEFTMLSCKYIEDIEERRHRPSVKALARIAAVLGVRVEELNEGEK